MRQIVDVDTGLVSVRRGGFVLRANAIGSCVVVAAYDARTRNGGMAHAMLPGRARDNAEAKTKYAHDAIECLLGLMSLSGSACADIQTCLVGAGNVLGNKDDTICSNNIASVTSLLAAHKIPVCACRLGGYERKSALLDVETGRMTFTQGEGPVTELWHFMNPATQRG